VRQLIDLRMLVEATLDFPEEEIDAVHLEAARSRLAALRRQVEQTLALGRQGSVLRNGLQVVLAGQPNVGKSSLLNRLAGEELAIVTEIPGTTRDAIRQTIEVGGLPVNIIDTAGLRDTDDAVEVIGIRRTWDAIEKADALLLMIDARAGVTPADEAIIRRLPAALKRITVWNKIDLTDARPAAQHGPDELHVAVSAKTGDGLAELQAALLELSGWQVGSEDAFMARERHLVALRLAGEALARAEAELHRSELFAEELRLAQLQLSSITGEFTADDLLGEIFSRFCIGK
jgi:tRNA modification GTPase